MGFVWTPVTVGSVVTIGHFREVQQNIIGIRTARGQPAYTWSAFPTTEPEGEVVAHADARELRLAIDSTLALSPCIVDNTALNTGIDSVQRVSVLNSQNTVVYSTRYSSDNGALDSTVYVGRDITILGAGNYGHNHTKDYTVNWTNCPAYNGADYGGNDGSACSKG